jgi:hypothetical protein
MSGTIDEYIARLDSMIKVGKLKVEYRDILLEIAALAEQADVLGLISGHGWGEDANRNVINKYEIFDNKGNILYLTLSDARSYLQNLITNYKRYIVQLDITNFPD